MLLARNAPDLEFRQIASIAEAAHATEYGDASPTATKYVPGGHAESIAKVIMANFNCRRLRRGGEGVALKCLTEYAPA